MSYERLVSEIKREFEDFEVIEKPSSLLMRFLAACLWLVTFGRSKGFLDEAVTTLGSRVYVPADWSRTPEAYRIGVLRHERVHMRQARAWGAITFSLLYLLAPLPLGLAWFRARFEWEAYEETMRATCDQYGELSIRQAEFREGIVQHFVGPQYGWMWPFRNTVESWYEDASRRILAERAESRPKGLLH